MKVKYDAPAPGTASGVADYAAVLLDALRAHGEVGAIPHADVTLYHVGNNQLHRDTYRRAVNHPGVVVLHDAVLNHFFLGSLSEKDYIDEYVYNYGEWSRAHAAQLWRERAGSGCDARYFDSPMLKRIASASKAIVVHNPGAAEMVRRHAPRAVIIEIPHFYRSEPAPKSSDIARYRQSLGAERGDFVFGVFGYIRESKRLLTVLQAFDALHRALPATRLLVAGHIISSDLERAAGPRLNAAGVIRRGFLKPRDFFLAAHAVDACINLRVPAAGETSGIAIRLMGAGKAVMLSEGAEISRFPAGSCLRIQTGVAERADLLEHMSVLTMVPSTAPEIGVRAAGYIGSHHPLDRIAEQYWSALCAHRN